MRMKWRFGSRKLVLIGGGGRLRYVAIYLLHPFYSLLLATHFLSSTCSSHHYYQSKYMLMRIISQFRRMVKHHGTPAKRSRTLKLGGSEYDIFKMTARERKSASYDGRDPLGPRNPDNMLKMFDV